MSNDSEGGGEAHRKRRRRLRKYDPYRDFPTNLLLERFYPVGKGKRARKFSPAQILLMRQYQDACEGNASGMKAIIRIIKENRKAWERAQKERVEPALQWRISTESDNSPICGHDGVI